MHTETVSPRHQAGTTPDKKPPLERPPGVPRPIEDPPRRPQYPRPPVEEPGRHKHRENDHA